GRLADSIRNIVVTGRRRRSSGRPDANFRCGVVSRPPAGVDAQEERDTMQRGRHLNLAALAGALALAAGMASAAPPPPAPTAAAPVGIFTGDAALSDGANMGSGSITVSGTGAAAVYTVTAIGEDIQGKADRGYFVYTNLPADGGITARVLSQTGGSKGGWAKDGVMLRQDTDPGSVMITLNAT